MCIRDSAYVDADALRSRLQAIDDAATQEGKLQKSAFDVLRDLLPDVSQQLEAAQGKHDIITLKMADVATKLGRTEMLSDLMGDLRLDIKGVSENERVKMEPHVKKMAGEMEKQISERAAADKAWKDSTNKVRDMKQEQLRAAGRSDLEARVAGTLYSIIASRMALTRGMASPEEWHQQFGMATMSSEQAAQMQAQPQPTIQPPEWMAGMVQPVVAAPTEAAAPAPQMTSLEQAQDLLTSPTVTLTPEQRTELEQYVQSAQGQELRSFIGPNSIQNLPEEQQQFMQDSLAAADAMAIAGKDNETIRTLTGWFVGLDGRWKFEIPDQEAELTWEAKSKITSYSKVMRLGEILDHQALYIAYPQLRNVSVDVAITNDAIFDGKPVQGYGVFYPEPVYDAAAGVMKGETHIKVRVKDEATLLSVLLHEAQHAIQYLEGVDLNKNKTNYAARSVEIEARNVQIRQSYTKAQRLSEPPFIQNGWSSFRNIDLNDAVVVDAVPARTKTAGRVIAGTTGKTDAGIDTATESGYFLKYVYGPASNASTAKSKTDAGLIEAYVPVIDGTPDIIVHGWARAFTSEAAAMEEATKLRTWRRQSQKSIGVQRVFVNNSNPALIASDQSWDEYLRKEFGQKNSTNRFIDSGLTGIIDGESIFVPDASQITSTRNVLQSQQPEAGVGGTYSRLMRRTVLNPNAQPTTWFHELMHFMFDTYANMIADGSATPEMRQDFETLLSFAKFDQDFDAYMAADLDTQRRVHETVAYSWENWLWGVKDEELPLDIRRLFTNIRRFFVDTWKSLTRLDDAYYRENGEHLPGLTDEVKAVFRRMVASEDQIKMAEATQAAVPLFVNKDAWVKAGLNSDEWDRYNQQERLRLEEAAHKLTIRGLAELANLHGTHDERLAQLKKQQALVREEMRKDAEADVASERIYRLRDYLLTGNLTNDQGVQTEEPAKIHKISRASVANVPLAAKVVMDDLDRAVATAQLNASFWDKFPIEKLERLPQRVSGAGSTNVKQIEKEIAARQKELAALPEESPDRESLVKVISDLELRKAERQARAETRDNLDRQAAQVRARNEQIKKDNAEIDAGRREAKEQLKKATDERDMALARIEMQQAKKAAGGKLAPYLAEEGLDVATVADLFGYVDVVEMVKDLMQAPTQAEAVELEIDRRMLRDYGDLVSQEAMTEAVTMSLYNEHNTRWLTLELSALQKAQRGGANRPQDIIDQQEKQRALADLRADLDELNNRLAQARDDGDQYLVSRLEEHRRYLREYMRDVERDAEGALSMRVMRHAARSAAKMVLDRTAIREVRPDRSAASERRASREALAKLTENDLPGAVQAKREQLLHNQMVVEGNEIRSYVNKTLKWYKSILRRKDQSLAKTRSLDFVYAIRAILLAMNVGGSDRQQQVRNEKARVFMERLQKYEPSVYAEVQERLAVMNAKRQSYKDMTVAEFRQMEQAIRALWNEAAHEKAVKIEGQRVEVAEIEEGIAARAEEIAPKGPRPGTTEAVTRKQMAVNAVMGVVAAMRRAQSVFDEWDGKLPGVFTKYFWRPIEAATIRYRAGRDKMHAKFVAILQEAAPSLQRDMADTYAITEKHIGYRFGTMQELVAAITNTGNLSNKSKMTVGGRGKNHRWARYNEETGEIDFAPWDNMVQELVAAGILTKQHFDTAQKIWDLNAEMLPDIQRTFRERYGYFFDEVKPEAFTITFPDGTAATYAGGYVPAKTDRDLVYDVGNAEAVADVEQSQRDMLPATGWTFTIKRMEKYMKPLDLDLTRQWQHIEAVQRFIHIQPALWSAVRLLRSERITAAFDSIDPNMRKQMLMPWLERVASQRTSTPSSWPAMDKVIRTARNRAGMAIMFANLSNTVQQLTGLFPALLKVKASYLAGALNRIVFTSSEKRRLIYAEICDKSQKMDQRFRTQIFQLQEDMNEVLLNPSKYDKAKSFAKKHAYFMQQYAQNLIDSVVWSGAYNQAIADGVIEAEAVARADAAVTLTQGGTQPENIAKVEAGGEFVRTFTQFTNYFNMMFNLNANAFMKWMRESGWRSNKKELFYAWNMGFVVPTAVAAMIAKTFAGKWDDEDDDGYGDELGLFALDVFGRGALAMIPGGSMLAAVTINRFDDATYNDSMLNTPVAGAVERAFGGGFELIKAVLDPDKDVTQRKIRDAMTLFDLVAGIPVSGIAGKLMYGVRSVAGEQENYGVLDALRGTLTGTAAEGTRQK